MQRAQLALALPACMLAWFALIGLAVAPASAQPHRPTQNRGLWIGPIPACAGTVVSVTVETYDSVGEPQAVVTFRPAWRAALLRETTRLVGRSMPVRLDGRTLMAPMVREPITGGAVALMPFDAGQIERIRAATAQPCPRGVR